MRPDGLIVLGAGPSILGEAAKNAKVNQATRAAALHECLEPIRLEQAEGPEHPALAQSLRTLARGYVALGDLTRAEPLFQRALAIQEKALGPDDPDTVATLDGYAALLRKAHRNPEAVALEVRAQVIRAAADTSRESGAALATGAPSAAADPATPSVGTGETAE
jgi:tetratricopeptide (TPR) repeat protein